MGQLQHDFALWQHIQCGKNGHLWQNRFFSCPVDEESVWRVLSYVELNPVRARIVERAYEYEWSSAQAHMTGLDSTGLLDLTHWRRSFNEVKWKTFLEQKVDDGSLQSQIRRTTERGYFLGDEATALRLEGELGMQLLSRRRGRKRRYRDNTCVIGEILA